MKFFTKTYPVLFFCFISISFSSCYIARAYKFRNFNLQDHTKLDSKNIMASTNPFEYAKGLNSYSTPKEWLDNNLKNTQTAAFLVIKNDSIVYEKYFTPFAESSLLPSFSVTKSFVSTLVGIALEEGKIKSLQQPITDYIPELLKSDNRFKNITLQNLLDMRSGIKWREDSYGLKDDAIKLGFRPNMLKHIKKIKIDSEPKNDSTYKSINTMLLGIAITRATGFSLTKYLQQKLWNPLGMQHNATWNTDKKGLEITYGGLNATAVDFAKLGTLLLHNGKVNNSTIISQHWINSCINKDTMFAYASYKNQWWGTTSGKSFRNKEEAETLTSKNSPSSYMTTKQDSTGTIYRAIYQTDDYFAEGILGQFVYVCPSKNIVVVRLGHNWSHPKYYAKQLIREAVKLY
jgi:CubicO group peptidase (beta-lactamase class C family)